MAKKKRAMVKKMKAVAKKMKKPKMEMEVEVSVEKPKKMRKAYPKGKKAEDKVEKVMHEYKEGELHSGSKKGPQVTNRKQAIAIALSEARKVKKKKTK